MVPSGLIQMPGVLLSRERQITAEPALSLSRGSGAQQPPRH